MRKWPPRPTVSRRRATRLVALKSVYGFSSFWCNQASIPHWQVCKKDAKIRSPRVLRCAARESCRLSRVVNLCGDEKARQVIRRADLCRITTCAHMSDGKSSQRRRNNRSEDLALRQRLVVGLTPMPDSDLGGPMFWKLAQAVLHDAKDS